MQATSVRRLGLTALLLGALVSCDGTLTETANRNLSEGELTFVRFAPDAPPLADTVVTFWARRGEDRQVRILYQTNGTYPNGICLEFRVGAGALLPDQEGMDGDSIQITVRLVDVSRFDFRFEPAGLRFAPESPAELRVFYRWADRDYNGDGVIDQYDQVIAERFAIWRQERPGDPWTKIPTLRLEEVEEIHARITGFTRYAVASD